MEKFLEHVYDVEVGVNEIVTPETVNRNVEKLLENDAALAGAVVSAFDGMGISEYRARPGGYMYGDLVWYRRGSDLYLLKCLIDGNETPPSKAFAQGGDPDFRRYGWKDENEVLQLSALGMEAQLQRTIDGFVSEHDADASMHPFGRVSSAESDPDYVGGKFLARDMSNADPSRKALFFPFVTGHFATDSVLDGVYRLWDDGVLEIDMVFRVGFRGLDRSRAYDVTLLSANDVAFRQSPTANRRSLQYQENDRYFYSADDMSIFVRRDGEESQIEGTRQGNRNDYVNAYFADLDFSGKIFDRDGNQVNGFSDVDYMVFAADTLSQDRNMENRAANPGSNAMTFCNKTRQSLTAVYITTPEDGHYGDRGYNARNGGIVANSFTCKLVGRWDKAS